MRIATRVAVGVFLFSVVVAAQAPLRRTVVATWYGKAYHGRITASGERFDMDKYTIACNWLPLKTVVELTYGEQTVLAWVSDRMADGTADGRIDVSAAIAEVQGWTKRGKVKMTLEVKNGRI